MKKWLIPCILIIMWLFYPILPGEVKSDVIPYWCVFQDETVDNETYEKISEDIYLRTIKELNDENAITSIFCYNEALFALEHNSARMYFVEENAPAESWSYIDFSDYGVDGVIKKDNLMYFTTGKRSKRFSIPSYFVDGQPFRVYRPEYYVYNFESEELTLTSKSEYFKILNSYNQQR